VGGACSGGAGGGTEALGGGDGDGGRAAQVASARAATVGSRKPAGRIGSGRESEAFTCTILYEPTPHPPPQPGRPAAGVWQIDGPGARPGPGLGAIGQNGRQQPGQRIGRGGHRWGRSGGAAAGFSRVDSGDMAGFYRSKPDARTAPGPLGLSPILNK